MLLFSFLSEEAPMWLCIGLSSTEGDPKPAKAAGLSCNQQQWSATVLLRLQEPTSHGSCLAPKAVREAPWKMIFTV